jgi:hypothetical protein
VARTWVDCALYACASRICHLEGAISDMLSVNFGEALLEWFEQQRGEDVPATGRLLTV